VREDALPYAREVADRLRKERIRVRLDEHMADMRERIREAQHRRASYIVVVGGKEAEARTVSVRRRGAAKGEEERGVALEEFVRRITEERETQALPADFVPGDTGPSVDEAASEG